jgi:mannosyltransferase OCH1-like enzyme
MILIIFIIIYIILVLIILGCFYTINNKNRYKDINNEREKIVIYMQPYINLKKEYNPIIPLKIYQTWYTKNLPIKMKENIEKLKRANPEFEHYLFDDNDCREFIKDKFDKDVLMAYDTLIPGAYKADLWRLCILYVNGGIYIDVKLNCMNGFKLMELTEENHFVLDRVPPLSIYNALMVCEKGHPFLLMGINKIVENVKNKFYGKCPLEPTGPVMLGNLILKNKLKLNTDLVHYIDSGYLIYKSRFVISTAYPEYDKERSKQNKELKTKRYDLLWNDKNIYKRVNLKN